MASGQDTELEKAIDEACRTGDVEALDEFLQRKKCEETPIKCSKHFLKKLDTFISRSLDEENSKPASLGFAILYKCGKNLKVPGGGQGLSEIIAQGLIKKHMVQWFEKCRRLWIKCGPQWDETLFNLSEDFFDSLMVAHEACKGGTFEITESFLYPIGQLAVDARIDILIQKEAIRKFNLILDKIPVELKKERKILASQEASDIMIKLAGQILEGGDYDLQTALVEALCRMATPGQRKELTDRWFSMEHVASAFAKIRDSDFETDCRMFLNLVNGMQGDRRRVYSYPCLEVYLDKYELLMPTDEKLEEFWIDFNLSSHSISFYFSLADEEAQESQWETICINENEVQSYTVTEKGKRQILQLKLSDVVVVGMVEGSSLTIYFSSSLDVLQAACNVYGHRKNKGFVGKTGISVVKTAINVVMEENSSQVVVPESPLSQGGSEKNTAPILFLTPSAPVQTPAKMMFSESTTFISGSGGRRVQEAWCKSLFAALPSDTPVKVKGKPSLEMVQSCDRQSTDSLVEVDKTCNHGKTPSSRKAGGMRARSTASNLQIKNEAAKQKKKIPLERAVDLVLAGPRKEPSQEDCFVPDTQTRTETRRSSNGHKLSVSEMLMTPTQQIKSLPKSEPCSNFEKQQLSQSSAKRCSVPGTGPIYQKQLHTKLTQCLKEVLKERTQDLVIQEAAATLRKMSDSKCSSSVDGCVSTSKEKQVQEHGLTKGKSKGQLALEGDGVLVRAPIKTSTTKILPERTMANVKDKTSKADSRKEKRDAEVAGNMEKFGSSHYKINNKSKTNAKNVRPCLIPPIVNRPIFNMSWFLTNREESGAVGLLKSSSKRGTSSSKQRKDVFAFKIESPFSIIGKDKTFTDKSAISSSGIHDSSMLLAPTKTRQPATKDKQYARKNLFSDTDTDNVMTEVSWLRESNKKPKPKITKYSRQAPVKPKAVSPHTSYASSRNKNARNNMKMTVKKAAEQPKQAVKPSVAPDKPHAAARRSQRAAATTSKTYREPDTDSSQSECEELPATKTGKTQETAEMRKKNNAGKQTSKSYKKLEIYNIQSESVSEQPLISKKYVVGQQKKREKTCSDSPEVKKRKMSSDEQSSDSCLTLDSNKQSDLKKPACFKRRPENRQETAKFNETNVFPVQEQMNPLKEPPAAYQASFSPSPPCIERMRSAERSAPTSGLSCSPLLTPRGSPLPASPDPPSQDNPSPFLMLPKPRSADFTKGNSKPSSYCSAGKQKKCTTSKPQSNRSVCLPTSTGQAPAPRPLIGRRAVEASPSKQCPHSTPITSRHFCPPLTSTLQSDKPSMPSANQSLFPEGTINHERHHGFSKVAPVSQGSLSQSSSKSSVLTSRVKDSPFAALTVSHTTEKTPASDEDRKPAYLHVSGPSRRHRVSLSSNSEEDEKKKSTMRVKPPPRMKPRKLFKSCTEVSTEGEISSFLTLRANGDMDMDDDLESPDVSVNPSNLCRQFSTELKMKFQKRNKMMEVYNKQSLKTVQQHVSLLNMQVSKHRTQSFEEVKNVLLEEIQRLEQCDTALANMEKDMSMYWKKQTMSFHSYCEQETRRNETLKKTLQSNECHSLEYEERMFTSQMCLLRKDMKSVQDRLLGEMQEEEIQSVKRGLHALFFPD